MLSFNEKVQEDTGMRIIDEIFDWLDYNDEMKLAILEDIKQRDIKGL